MKYNKLVRDKIPEIIREKGGNPVTRFADEAEYRNKLIEKLLEEIKEFAAEPNLEELADIREVLDALQKLPEFSENEVSALQNKKAAERGKFEKRIILEES